MMQLSCIDPGLERVKIMPNTVGFLFLKALNGTLCYKDAFFLVNSKGTY